MPVDHPMEVHLSDGLYAAVWGNDLVFFDAVAGEYQMMAGAGVAVRASSGPCLVIEDEKFVEFLREQGLLAEGDSRTADVHAPPPLPTRSSLSVPIAGAAKGHQRKILRAYAEMPMLYVGRQIPFLLKHSRARPTRGPRIDPQELAQSFEALRPLLPWQGACVFRAFMLMRLLSRSGGGKPRWVFGVRTWPFYAHCWIQDGDVALTDYAECLERYTPIFAL